MIQKFSDKTQSIIDIEIDIEEVITADSGRTAIIPLSSKWHTLGIQVSGGLDSALLLYLTAKIIKQRNLNIKIQPIVIDLLVKVDNDVTTTNVINKVRDLLSVDFIKDKLTYTIPEELSTIRRSNIGFIDGVIRNLIDTDIISAEFNANTKNPPAEIRQNFINDDYYRLKNRDSRTSVYNAELSMSPFALIDKQDIVNLYIKENILDQLSPLTISCNENTRDIEANNLPVPCGQCWWCQERRWGFSSNNATDTAPIELPS